MEDETNNNLEHYLRDQPNAWPKSLEELTKYIQWTIDQKHTYGSCVYAMSLAATATFNYLAHELGVTGFQASCADLDLLKRTRGINGPFMIIRAEEALYPQYDLHRKLDEALLAWRPWFAEEATKMLDKRSLGAHEAVVAHWKKLAAYKDENET